MAKIRSGTTTDELTVDATSKAARATLYSPAGDPVGNILGSTGQYSLNVNVVQNVELSTLNSSTSPIADGNEFTGLAESTLGVNLIQVNIFADRNLILYCEQSMNGTNWDIQSLPVTSTANAGFVRNYLATAAYYRVRVLNQSGGATSILRLQTALCPMGGEVQDLIKRPLLLAWEEMSGTNAVESELTNYTHGTVNEVALGADTSYTVTASRRLVLTSIGIYIRATGTDTNYGCFRLRAAEAIAKDSPIIFSAVLPGSSSGAVTAGGGTSSFAPIPLGAIELRGGMKITFTWLTQTNTCKVGMVIMGYEY
jgi:hypothetical protein